MVFYKQLKSALFLQCIFQYILRNLYVYHPAHRNESVLLSSGFQQHNSGRARSTTE